MCCVVGAGLAVAVLNPSSVAEVITVRNGLFPPPAVLAGWTVALCICLVGTLLWWWGPVRTTRAEALWRLAGPADRAAVLLPLRRRAVGIAGVGCALVASVVSIIDVGSAPVLVGIGILCAVLITIVASVGQGRRSVAVWTGTSGFLRGSCSPGRLHRDVVAPDDGLAGASRMALVTVDLDWIGLARTVRWQRVNVRRPSRRWPTGHATSLVVADTVRVLRRRGDLAWWSVLVAIGVAMPLTMEMSRWEPVVAALLAYRAGGVLAGGLRQVVSEPALGRALGLSVRRLCACHSVIPVAGVLGWAALTGVTWHMSIGALAVVAVGAAGAALRRATRPDLPFDAPVYVTGQGGAVQPLLLLAMARGPAAVVLTGLVATIIG